MAVAAMLPGGRIDVGNMLLLRNPCLTAFACAILGTLLGSLPGAWVDAQAAARNGTPPATLLEMPAAALPATALSASACARALRWAGVAATAACGLCCVRARGGLWPRQATALAALVLAFAARTASLPWVAQSALSVGNVWQVRVVGPVQRAAATHRPARLRLQADLLAERCAVGWQPRAGRGRLWLDASTAVGHGDRLLLRLDVLPFPSQRAPWGAAPGRQRQLRGESGRLRATTLPQPLPDGTTGSRPGRLGQVWGLADRLRQRAGAGFDVALSLPAAAVAKALALGDTASLAPTQRDAWSGAGIAHLLAVSGLHVSLWARALQALAQWVLPRLFVQAATRGRLVFWSAALSSCGVWGYAWLAGGQVSVLRAACMASAAQWGRALGRGRGYGLNALGLAGTLLLLRAPTDLYAPAFALSFVSVLGLLCLSGAPGRRGPPSRTASASASGLAWLQTCTARLLPPLRALCSRLEEACVASAVTAPLVAVYFGSLPLLAPLINLVAVPWGAGVATPLALLWVMAFAATPGDGALLRLLSACLEASLRPLEALAHWAAERPASQLAVTCPSPPLCLLLIAALLAACACNHRQQNVFGRACGAVLLLAASVTVLAWQRAPNTYGGALRLWHLDVGHGDATLVQLPCGDFFLIDAGGALSDFTEHDPGRMQVAPALRALGVRRLAAVLLTHPHPDHMGGLAYVAQHFAIDNFWFGSDADDVAPVQQLAATVRRRGGRAGRPPWALLWGGALLQFWRPLEHQEASFNDHALVLRIAYGNDSVLLTGDVEARAEAALAPCVPPSDVLKVAHHGSPTSSTEVFLQSQKPRLAVVSCGERNRFGFPHPQVVARLQAVGARVLDTGTHGVVTLMSRGRGFCYGHGAQPPVLPLDQAHTRPLAQPGRAEACEP